jgi:hypothetical protein
MLNNNKITLVVISDQVIFHIIGFFFMDKFHSTDDNFQVSSE